MGDNSLFCQWYPGQDGWHSFISALCVPAELVLGLVLSCWCRPGCCLWGLFSWSKGKALLIIWPLSHGTFLLIGWRTSPFMRLCLRAQFNLGIVLPGYYSTKAVAVFQLTTMERRASLQISSVYKCGVFRNTEIPHALS